MKYHTTHLIEAHRLALWATGDDGSNPPLRGEIIHIYAAYSGGMGD